jgi:hypothetical protein
VTLVIQVSKELVKELKEHKVQEVHKAAEALVKELKEHKVLLVM